ncbi:MAG: hypothetical protein MZW92_10290 [Comamonadaceae bacterium]|nr:hypothetical protein [Comamonadaceae bacterium]
MSECKSAKNKARCNCSYEPCGRKGSAATAWPITGRTGSFPPACSPTPSSGPGTGPCGGSSRSTRTRSDGRAQVRLRTGGLPAPGLLPGRRHHPLQDLHSRLRLLPARIDRQDLAAPGLLVPAGGYPGPGQGGRGEPGGGSTSSPSPGPASRPSARTSASSSGRSRRRPASPWPF